MRTTHLLSVLFALTLTTAALAQPKILSVTPSTGPTTGGTRVTVMGEGFLFNCGPITCPPNEIRFGGVAARETRVLDDTQITAVTPEHFPGTVDVTLAHSSLNEVTLANAFTFTGPVPETAFARVLLPIFTPPVRGAFGSDFRTEFRIAGNGGGFSTYSLRNDTSNCAPILCLDLPDPIFFTADDVLGPAFPIYNGNPGRFIYVPRSELKNVAANLRVADVSRSSLNFGTEIPVVADTELRSDVIELLGVPTDPRFRNTLRIYGIDASYVVVTVEGRQPVVLPMTQPSSPFEPVYAVFTDFPTGTDPVHVKIEPPPFINPSPPSGPFPIWAFVSVTNNETQMITTITPQP